MSKNVYEKLLEVRKAVPYLQKLNQGHQYNFVGSSDVVGAVREKLDEVGLLLFPKIKNTKVSVSSVTNRDKYGNEKITNTYFTELQLDFVWVCAESGEEVVVPFYAQGVDIGGEKGVGKALTYAEKYFLLKQFNIPTDHADPDTFQEKLDYLTPNFINKRQVEELKQLANKISALMSIPAENYINVALSNVKVSELEKVTVDKFEVIRSKLEHWLKQAKEKNNTDQQQTKNTNSQNQQADEQQSSQQPEISLQQNSDDKEIFVMGKKEIMNSPSGKKVVKFFVQGKNNSILARSEEVVRVISTINEGETFSGKLVEHQGFTFIESVTKVEQTSA